MIITDSKYYLIDLDGVILDTSYDNYFWQKHIPLVYAKKKSISEKDAISVTNALFNFKKKSKDWYDVVYWSNILDIDIIGEKKKPENKAPAKSGVSIAYMTIDNMEHALDFIKRLYHVGLVSMVQMQEGDNQR